MVNINKIQRAEFKYLKTVLYELDRDKISIKNFKNIDKAFYVFTKESKADSLSILRTGEVFLGKLRAYDSSDLTKIQIYMLEIISNDKLQAPVMIAVISALNKILLNPYNEDMEEVNNERES